MLRDLPGVIPFTLRAAGDVCCIIGFLSNERTVSKTSCGGPCSNRMKPSAQAKGEEGGTQEVVTRSLLGQGIGTLISSCYCHKLVQARCLSNRFITFQVGRLEIHNWFPWEKAKGPAGLHGFLRAGRDSGTHPDPAPGPEKAFLSTAGAGVS